MNTVDGSRRVRVIEAVRERINAEPQRFKSIWGSPLLIDQATVYHLEGQRYSVDIPEERADGLPCGLDLQIDLGTGECVTTPME
jgi:hypothetical protein